jgi:hypothetical protein
MDFRESQTLPPEQLSFGYGEGADLSPRLVLVTASAVLRERFPTDRRRRMARQRARGRLGCKSVTATYLVSDK